MKRIILILCMLTCLLTLSACGKKNETSTPITVQDIYPEIPTYVTENTNAIFGYIVGLDESTYDKEEEVMRVVEDWAMVGGLNAYKNAKSDLGNFVSVDEVIYEETETGLKGTLQAVFEKRNLNFTILYSKDLAIVLSSGNLANLQKISVSFEPEYTTGEKMQKAGLNTLMGMGTVFAVLIFISFIIGGFKYISVFENRLKKTEKQQESVIAPESVLTAEEPEELVDDMELVAVITAAIAAATEVPVEGLVVRSIKRAQGSKWKRL